MTNPRRHAMSKKPRPGQLSVRDVEARLIEDAARAEVESARLAMENEITQPISRVALAALIDGGERP